MPTMLHARILKSPYPHVKVKSIDVSGAEALGATVVTFEETPKVRYCPRLVSVPSATYKDWQVLTGKPKYVGEPIAAVAAETEEQAQSALEAIKVEYEQLEAVFNAVESMERETLIHEEIELENEILKVKKNVGCSLEITDGDVEKGFKEADIVIERTYRTNRRYHNQLETKGAVVMPEPDGGVTIWSTTQTIHNSRLLIHDIFGIPVGKIRVMKVALGGSFGSSIHVNPPVPIAVALALKSRRPVRLSYTRE